MKIIVFLFLIICIAPDPVLAAGKNTPLQKVTLKLLESISPQKHAFEEEMITSNLGDILKDPKNEALKAVKVLGRKKRVKDATSPMTQIIWTEVALDAEPSLEQAARGVQLPRINSLKEPIKKPLQSAFVQKAEGVQSGTPIEAKGDVEGLLAAARSLLIRAQRQGFKVMPPTVAPGAFTSAQAQVPSTKSRQRAPLSVHQGISGSVKPDKSLTQSRKNEETPSPKTFSGNEGSAFSSGYTSPGSKDSDAGSASSSDRSSSNRYSGSGGFFSGGSSYQSPRSSKAETPIFVNVPSSPASAAGTSDPHYSTPFPAGSSDKTRSKKANFSRNRGTPTNLFGEDSESEDESEDFEFPLGEREDAEEAREGVKIPKIEVKLNYDACSPRIDWQFKQVILQAQTLTFADGVKIDEQDCADTNKRFLIQKDYSCIDCEDKVAPESPPKETLDGEINFGFAYATYRFYWLDQDAVRSNLGDLQVDENHPFALREEPSTCGYTIDLDAKTATPQSELVYYNRTKQRIVVQKCRSSLKGISLPLLAKQQGCPMGHDFLNNRSMFQERFVFFVGGVETEAAPCQETGVWIPHQFEACKPLVDPSSRRYTPQSKRFVESENGEKVYVSPCVPEGDDKALQASSKACVGDQYLHDKESGYSFLKVRYFYPDHRYGNQPKFVTPCVASSEAFEHKEILKGFEHHDYRLESLLKTEIGFEGVDKEWVIVVPTQVQVSKKEPYSLYETTTELLADQAVIRDHCFEYMPKRKRLVYHRPDSSELIVYEAAGEAGPVDTCTRTEESRTKFDKGILSTHQPTQTGILIEVDHPVNCGFAYSRDPLKVWIWNKVQEYKRTKLTLKRGTVEYTPWAPTGTYTVTGLTDCRSHHESLKQAATANKESAEAKRASTQAQQESNKAFLQAMQSKYEIAAALQALEDIQKRLPAVDSFQDQINQLHQRCDQNHAYTDERANWAAKQGPSSRGAGHVGNKHW
jgi:hypothetical protein